MRVLARRDRHGEVERLLGTSAPAGRAIYWTSCYRIPGREGDVLVDSLSPRLAGILAGAWDRTPEVALLTHHHEDHSGGAAVLSRAGVRVLAPEPAVPRLREEWSLPFYRAFAWGNPRPAVVEAAPHRVPTSAGAFRAVASPGHSSDHVAWLHEERGWLFTGDAYFGRLRAMRAAEDVGTWIESLRALAALGPTRAFPAHGSVVESPVGALEDAADWLERLSSKARAMRSRGRSVREIRRDLLGPEGMLFYISRGDFSGANLIRAALALG